MFVANPNSKYIPSKSIELYPEARIDYYASNKGASQMKFFIPPYLQFIDPRTLRLQYDLTMEGRGMPKPSPSAGVSSFHRSLNVKDGYSLNTLEEVMEYNGRVAMEYSYTMNDDVRRDRELNEGLSETDNNRNQLFWSSMNSSTTKVEAPQTAKKVHISTPLWSGLLGKDSKLLPVGAMKGVRLTLQNDTIDRSVRNALNGTFSDAVDVKATLTKASFKQSANTDTLKVEVSTATGNANTQSFQIGDHLYATDTDEASAKSLGLLVSIETQNGNTALVFISDITKDNNTEFDYDLTTATKIFVKDADRRNGWTPDEAKMKNAQAQSQASLSTSYKMENVRLVMSQVSPPNEYVSQMVKKLQGEGIEMNYKNQTLYKQNVVGTNGVLQVSVPIPQGTRAYSLNCMPINTTTAYNSDNLVCNGADGTQNYQFSINGNLVPNEPSPMERLTLSPPRVEQQHLQEVRKGLINCGIDVKSLQNAEKNLLISRAFSKYGMISDVSKQDFSLRVEYSGATRQKTFNCYLCSLRTMNIKATGVEVRY